MNMKTILLSLLLLFLPSAVYSQPSISFEEQKHFLGIVNQTEKASHTFEFSNVGDQDLVIDKVTSS